MRKTFLTLAAVAGLIAAAGGAVAQDKLEAKLDDPVSLRINMMKQSGGAMKLLGDMAKGETGFEPRVALGALHALRAVSLGYAAQFPEGSREGHDTRAAPAIWEDRAGFEAAAARFIAATGAALESPPQDLDGVKATLGKLGETCKGCHEDYRLEKE